MFEGLSLRSLDRTGRLEAGLRLRDTTQPSGSTTTKCGEEQVASALWRHGFILGVMLAVGVGCCELREYASFKASFRYRLCIFQKGLCNYSRQEIAANLVLDDFYQHYQEPVHAWSARHSATRLTCCMALRGSARILAVYTCPRPPLTDH